MLMENQQILRGRENKQTMQGRQAGRPVVLRREKVERFQEF